MTATQRAAGSGEALPRIAFYSHDATGLGHVRRNLGIARAVLTLGGPPQILLVSGTGDAARLELPANAELVVLPGVHKDRDGRYRPRRLDPRELDRILELRRAALKAVLRAFDPDVLVVDRYARGFRGELEGALDVVRGLGGRIVLGIRDVIDEPEAVRADWAKERADEALERWYDGVLAFTDPKLLEPLAPLTGQRPVPITSTGYLVPRASGAQPQNGMASGAKPLVLCTVGGGADGREVTTAVARAPRSDAIELVVLAGPQMPAHDREELESIASERPGLTILEMVADPWPLLARASAVIAMAGYNTSAELLGLDVPVLLVPRPFPRAEQRIRAAAFAAHGLADVLQRDQATPEAIGEWIARAVGAPRVDRSAVDRGGHEVAARAIGNLVRAGRR